MKEEIMQIIGFRKDTIEEKRDDLEFFYQKIIDFIIRFYHFKKMEEYYSIH
jgi:hypothetical protein